MKKRYHGKSLGRTAMGLRVATAMVASLGVMAAVGCSSAEPADDPAGDVPEAEQVEQGSAVVLTMEYADGNDLYDQKSIELADASLVADGAVLVNGVGAENTYVYKGFAHGDIAHYSMYSLYTELITDENGLLTAVNLTSGADTWSGKWGAKGSKPTLYGMLPEGVTFDSAVAADGDNTVTTPTLTVEAGTEVEAAGYDLTEIYLYNVLEDGTTVGVDVEGKKGRVSHQEYDAVISFNEENPAASVDADTYAYDVATDAITVKGGAFNLLQLKYLVGTEVYIEQWIVLGENANAAAFVESHAEVFDTTVSDVVEGTGVTNRTKWTYSMMSIMETREFASWASTFEDVSLYTGGNDGEIGDVDTISGATKTSIPFQSAVNQAISSGYITGIAEDVAVSIDGGELNADGIDVDAVHQDQTVVTVNEDGQYVLTANFPAGIDEAADGDLSHAVCVTHVELFALGDQNLGTLGVWNLGKGTSGFTPVATITDTADEPGDVDDAMFSYVSDWEYRFNPVLIVKDPSITHVVVHYEIGHDSLGIAYDLAAMAHAGVVDQMIADMDASDAAAVAAAREAFDALPYDVQGMVANDALLFEAEGK